MRGNGGREGWVCGVIFGGVSKQVLSAEGIKLMGPCGVGTLGGLGLGLGFGFGRRHGELLPVDCGLALIAWRPHGNADINSRCQMNSQFAILNAGV